MHPDKQKLLEGVAKFLEELKPALADPGLAYRALVAASLVRMVGAEVRDPALEERALARLRAVGPEGQDVCGLSAEDKERLRLALMENLREELAITNPRFDPKAEVD